MFGVNIDPQQMMQLQQNAQMCAQHPGCDGCQLYSLQGVDGVICENALMRLSQGGNADESGQSDTTQQGTQETV